MEKRSLQDKNNTKSTSSEDESNIESSARPSARLSSGATVRERTSASQHEEPTLGTSAGQHERPTPWEQGAKQNTNEQSEKQTEYSDSLAVELLSHNQEPLSGLQADDTSRHTGREAAEENEDFLPFPEQIRCFEVPPSVWDLIDAISNEQKSSDSNLLAPSTSRGLTPDVSDSTEEISDERRSLDFDPLGPSTSSGYPIVDELSPESQDLQHEDGDYECGLCEFKTEALENLKQHINKYHENETKECKKCSTQYDIGNKLAMHIYNKHKLTKYSCKNCGNVFETRKILYSHSKGCRREQEYLPPSIVNIGRPPIQPRTLSENQTYFECVSCHVEMPPRFSTLPGINKHITHYHENARFLCRRCNQYFLTQEEFLQHINQLHRIEPYKCIFCNKIFNRHHELRNHVIKCKTQGGTSKEAKKPKRG